METVLEWEEIQVLLREALAARGVVIPSTARMVYRLNNKRGDCRLVFKCVIKEAQSEEDSRS